MLSIYKPSITGQCVQDDPGFGGADIGGGGGGTGRGLSGNLFQHIMQYMIFAQSRQSLRSACWKLPSDGVVACVLWVGVVPVGRLTSCMPGPAELTDGGALVAVAVW